MRPKGCRDCDGNRLTASPHPDLAILNPTTTFDQHFQLLMSEIVTGHASGQTGLAVNQAGAIRKRIADIRVTDPGLRSLIVSDGSAGDDCYLRKGTSRGR
jgi:hypothetical protein